MEINPMNLTKVKPVENGNPKKTNKKTCQLCLNECLNKNLMCCPVNNNCDYTICVKCIALEKQRLINEDINETYMICPACRNQWSVEDSIRAEHYRMFGNGGCPCYCICVDVDKNWFDCICVKNINHCYYRNKQIKYIYEKKNECIETLCFLKSKFSEQKELIRVLQGILILMSFRFIFNIYACLLPNVEINTSEDDWCLPFLTPWFVVLSIAGMALFAISIFVLAIGIVILLSFIGCLCSSSEDDDIY